MSRERPPEPILLVGFSVRMLAELAVRAGYDVRALDYFGDRDLQALCPSRSLLRDDGGAYSARALADAASDIPAPSVAYTSSFENHPAEVARLMRGRTLLGNPPDVLARARDPLRVMQSLREAGFAAPETRLATDAPPDRDRRWLWKPLKSGGGHAVRGWRGGAPRGAGVWQERLSGPVCSAAFVADGERAVLLGVTEQLVGLRAFGARGFRYCGNLLPPRVTHADLVAMARELESIVSHVTAAFGLRGVNGIDFVWRDRRAWTIEINPRPAASLELIDRAYDLRVFDLHARSFAGELPRFDLLRAIGESRAAGKTIVFAPHDLRVGDTSHWYARDIRDVPHSGERIGRGHPVCTILAEGESSAACLERLRERAAELATWWNRDHA
jgi:predicted ATP-grasp superfamily ATP-dependent carboligase